MTLKSPFCISARLLPAVQLGDVFISITFEGQAASRAVYRYYIDGPQFEHTSNDLKYGVGGGTLQDGMASLLSFLSACGTSFRTHGENADLFPPKIGEWCYQNCDELAMLQLEIEETPGLIEA